jgi:pilus assembly protein Flp/PilA
MLDDDSGSSAAEYGLVASLVAIVVITGVIFAGNMMGGFFNYIGSEVTNAIPTGSSLFK